MLKPALGALSPHRRNLVGLACLLVSALIASTLFPWGGSTADAASALQAAGNPPCDDIAAVFVTKGSANADLPDPEVNGTCTGATVTVTSNQIPDFPYIQTSPGDPEEYDIEHNFPATAVWSDELTDIAALGAIAIAINGIPIYGATEGTGGDVMSLNGGFTECGGHNGPTGYHFHTFDVTGSDSCLFSQAEAEAAPVLFGYAFDGYPIYSGNFQYTSSWELTNPSLFASDTFSAHTYTPGSGDLDQCNGRTDDDGNYAYYTTDSFPYTLGCYHGIAATQAGGGEGGPGPGGPGPGGPGPGEPVAEVLCNNLAITVDLNDPAPASPTSGDDVILGTAGDDVIDGLGGNDTICGGDGDDMVIGGDGNDVIIGGAGADRMFGESGRDIIRGNEGDDVIFGGSGDDRLLGGVGDDELNGGAGSDFLGGFGGNDMIVGDAGNDTIFGGYGADEISGGDGDDTIFGLIGDDTINGDAGNDTLNGNRGNDTINGGDGDDQIAGGNADDVLNGDAGDDSVNGGRADDQLSGGEGLNDTCAGNLQNVADTADDTCELIIGVP